MQLYKSCMEPVVDARIHQNGKFGFVTLADETLASTLVRLKMIDVGYGKVNTGWPSSVVDAVSRAAPSLDLDDDGDGMVNLRERHECEIFVGGFSKWEDPGLALESY